MTAMRYADVRFDAVTDGKLAFLNLSADVQMWDVAGLLDPERVVLEIPESITVEVLDACADLQRSRSTNARPGSKR